MYLEEAKNYGPYSTRNAHEYGSMDMGMDQWTWAWTIGHGSGYMDMGLNHWTWALGMDKWTWAWTNGHGH